MKWSLVPSSQVECTIYLGIEKIFYNSSYLSHDTNWSIKKQNLPWYSFTLLVEWIGNLTQMYENDFWLKIKHYFTASAFFLHDIIGSPNEPPQPKFKTKG